MPSAIGIASISRPGKVKHVVLLHRDVITHLREIASVCSRYHGCKIIAISTHLCFYQSHAIVVSLSQFLTQHRESSKGPSGLRWMLYPSSVRASFPETIFDCTCNPIPANGVKALWLRWQSARVARQHYPIYQRPNNHYRNKVAIT